MYAIYNFTLYLFTLLAAPVVLLLLLSRRRYAQGFFQKCGLLPWKELRQQVAAGPVWIHAVSVGEVMGAIPLVQEIRNSFPRQPLILSTVTATGKLIAQRSAHGADQIIYFPFDYPPLVKLFIARLAPVLFITFETEIWPNFLRELKRQGIPSLMMSGRISSRSFRNYHFFRFFFKRVLENISGCCMQSQVDAERIIAMGADPAKIVITGNLKFDQHIPQVTQEERAALYASLQLQHGQHLFIAGSTHQGEEEIILEVYRALKSTVPDLVLMVAPRHPQRFAEVESLIQNKGFPVVRKTALAASSVDTQHAVILLDTIGELAKLYCIGTIVFIGGSLVPVGGHNILEPAVFKKPILFGPYMANFSAIARILKKSSGAVQVQNQEEFTRQATRLLTDAQLREQIGDAAFRVIQENSGALHKSMEILRPILERQTQHPLRPGH